LLFGLLGDDPVGGLLDDLLGDGTEGSNPLDQVTGGGNGGLLGDLLGGDGDGDGDGGGGLLDGLLGGDGDLLGGLLGGDGDGLLGVTGPDGLVEAPLRDAALGGLLDDLLGDGTEGSKIGSAHV